MYNEILDKYINNGIVKTIGGSYFTDRNYVLIKNFQARDGFQDVSIHLWGKKHRNNDYFIRVESLRIPYEIYCFKWNLGIEEFLSLMNEYLHRNDVDRVVRVFLETSISKDYFKVKYDLK